MTINASIPPEQLEALRAQFDVIDQDGDGQITSAELTAILEREAYDYLDAAQKQSILDTFAAADANRDRVVDFDEFVTLFAGAATQDPDAALRESFARYDLDGDGYLTPEDFKRISAEQGEELSDEQARDMIAMADENGNGKVSFEEYRKIMSAS
ncbi:MAG: EF-hand domain-containing protein [Myxococcales bacterium]|nr:EF-hand domain-containing protein [Myxococcales bacterium]